MSEENVYSEKEVDQIVAKYRTLCAHAADALEEEFYAYGLTDTPMHKLITELRKAAHGR